MYLGDGATFDNEPGALFSFISDASVNDGGGTPDGGTFVNAGTLAKTGGTGVSAINVAFSNAADGAVQAISGRLSLNNSLALNGLGFINVAGREPPSRSAEG